MLSYFVLHFFGSKIDRSLSLRTRLKMADISLQEYIRANNITRRGLRGGWRTGRTGGAGHITRGERPHGESYWAPRFAGGITKNTQRGPPRRFRDFDSHESDSRWNPEFAEDNDDIIPMRAAGRDRGFQQNGTRLIISNLEIGVTEEDIYNLFVEIGPIASSAVHYDGSGRYLGTAEVVFEREEDALSAFQKYNRVALDGKLMEINIIPGQSSNGYFQRQRQRDGSGRGRNRRLKREDPEVEASPTKPLTVELNELNLFSDCTKLFF